MKKFLGTLMLAFISVMLFSQSSKKTITLKVIDATSKNAVSSATVNFNNQFFMADENGNLTINQPPHGNYVIKTSCIGFEDKLQTIDINATTSIITIQLKSIALFLQPLEVKALRATNKAPFAKTNFSKTEIEKNNIGQDLPFILNQTPSVYVSSDAGNGVGYTYMHIRGIDASRINVTLNGIPYNDAESQATYFVDLPDFSSSLNSIQIQRGVGTSSNGAGAFGASINLSTNEFNEKPYAELNNSYGSFNTWKNTVKAGTGLINGHFTVDARLSKIVSAGYIDRASSDLRSVALSAAYINKNSSIIFNVFTGKEKTYQAWYGVPDYLLATDRTYNPAGTEKTGTPYNNQTDNYQQDHYQLFYNVALNKKWSFNTAAFLTYGRGYYEEYKATQKYSKYGLPNVVVGSTTFTTTDLIRDRWLNNYFYGEIFSLQYKNVNDELTFGGGWNTYDGQHYGNIIWAKNGGISNNNYQYYNYPALKTDQNIYAKWQHNLNAHWLTYADLQYRHVYYNMNGFEGNSTLNITRNFNFINPKAGITYTNNGLQAYFSYALAGKEPNRDDFQASLASQPQAEYLHDFELGFEKKNTAYSFSANVYYMLYKNQLVLTGQINDVGSYTRTNVPNSYRLGIELQGNYIFSKWLNANANLTLSQNKIKSYTEYIDNYDNGLQNAVQHNNTDISFSPNTISGITVNILPAKNIMVSLIGKYVSKQYMDNAQLTARSLNSFYNQNIRLSYSIQPKFIKEINLSAQVINLFNKMYQPNGYTYSYISANVLTTQNNYFPMAGTNYMFTANIKL